MSELEPDALEKLLDSGYRYALALCANPAVAEDLVQESVTRMLHRGAPMQVGYLFRSIRNRFIDENRSMRLAVLHADEVGADDRADADIERSIEPQDLAAALSQLRPDEREVLYLVVAYGYTLAETAELTDRPPGTVASLLRRGRSRLVRLLSDDRQEAS